ncbi:hypothetical protein PG989_002317 [Apiospora arundinis]
MAGSTSFNLTREQEIGILALLIYLNTGAAWYFYISRKSEGYDDFEYGIIGSPPGASLPRPRFDGPSVKYALKRWAFITASVLLFWVGHALFRFYILLFKLFTWLGAKIAACAYVVHERIWKRDLWKARRDWEKELAIDGPYSADGGKTTKPPAVWPRDNMTVYRAT